MRTAEKCCVLQQLATAPNRDENYRVCAQGHRLFRHGKCCTVRLDGVKENKKSVVHDAIVCNFIVIMRKVS